MQRFGKLMILLIILLLSGAVYAWFYVFNEGIITFHASGLSDYSVTHDDFNSYCEEDLCTLRLPIGFYNLSLIKEGYFELNQTVQVSRGQTQVIKLHFIPIPQLVVSPVIPVDEEGDVNSILPNALLDRAIFSPAWNANATKLAFIDSADQRLKIWHQQNIRSITPLSVADLHFEWSPHERYLFGYKNDAFYFIDLKEARRYKIMADFMVTSAMWSPDEQYVLVNSHEGQLYRFSLSDQQIVPLSFAIDLKQARFLSPESLIFFSSLEEGGSSIQQFDPVSQLTHELIQTPLVMNEIRLSQGKVYLRDRDRSTWYLLQADTHLQ